MPTPDRGLGRALPETCRRLIPPDAPGPAQADLRRAISTAYYAAFHALAETCADRLVGAEQSTRPNRAWVEVYRGLEHGTCLTACEGARNTAFPEGIKDFASGFVRLHRARESCDYDPMVRPTRALAMMFIESAENAVTALQASPEGDQVAFVSWVLITGKGAQRARTLVRTGQEGQLATPAG
ncbi:MAG: hypothetical protein GDA53_06540 [Rhodobacteraceae bacterium]|nr:hypothetical protein [Paracoccaceae bacterium]